MADVGEEQGEVAVQGVPADPLLCVDGHAHQAMDTWGQGRMPSMLATLHLKAMYEAAEPADQAALKDCERLRLVALTTRILGLLQGGRPSQAVVVAARLWQSEAIDILDGDFDAPRQDWNWDEGMRQIRDVAVEASASQAAPGDVDADTLSMEIAIVAQCISNRFLPPPEWDAADYFAEDPEPTEQPEQQDQVDEAGPATGSPGSPRSPPHQPDQDDDPPDSLESVPEVAGAHRGPPEAATHSTADGSWGPCRRAAAAPLETPPPVRGAGTGRLPVGFGRLGPYTVPAAAPFGLGAAKAEPASSPVAARPFYQRGGGHSSGASCAPAPFGSMTAPNGAASAGSQVHLSPAATHGGHPSNCGRVSQQPPGGTGGCEGDQRQVSATANALFDEPLIGFESQAPSTFFPSEPVLRSSGHLDETQHPWRGHAVPGRSRGYQAWDESEERLLLAGHAKFGNSWELIRKNFNLEHRLGTQLREKWRNIQRYGIGQRT